MRENSEINRINRFMDEIGKRISKPTEIYFSGGATAVMNNIRSTTIDVDIRFDPESDEVYKAIKELKELLNMNIEMASPFDFIPILPQWKERNIFIRQVKLTRFFHLDPYAQIISKVQRGWNLDLKDASAFMRLWGNESKLIELFKAIKENFITYPNVDVLGLQKKLEMFINETRKQ